MSAFLVDGCCWDEFDAYLFDIDGTLLNCTDAIHYYAFCDALRKLSGRALTLESVTAHGNTDIGILRDALALAGVAEEKWRPRLAEIRDTMGLYVATRREEVCATALSGVHSVLQHLRGRGATLGIATGNLREIGRIKLQKAGLLSYFEVEGWSDEYENRADVFRGAMEQMYAVTGTGASLCVFGDTPADVHAAHVNGLPAIAVATGVYSREQLLTARPDLCVQSLEDLISSGGQEHSGLR